MSQESAKGEYLRFPTPSEMLALELAARRAQAEAIASLFAAAGRQLKKIVVRGGAMATASQVHRKDAAPRDISQFPTKRNTMSTLFWKDALASLPPSVQRRYAASFEAAERFEALIDMGVEAWGSFKQALAMICQAAARAMRGTARFLEGAAQRLLPMH